MTKDSNDICDISQFLYSPIEMNEVSNHTNLIQSSDNFFLEDFGRNVVDGPESNHSFQLIQQDLTYDPGTEITNHSSSTLDQNSEIDSFKILYPNLSSSSHSSTNCLPTRPNDDPDSQITFSNSNELVYENLPTMQPHQNPQAQGFSNSIEIRQPMYPNNSNSQQPTAIKVYTPAESLLLPRVEKRHPKCNESQSSPNFYVDTPNTPSFPLTIQTNEKHDPLVLVPLSMLQLDKFNTETPQHMFSRHQTGNSFPSKKDNDTTISQDILRVTDKKANRRTHQLQSQHCHKNKPKAEKLSQKGVRRKQNAPNIGKRQMKNAVKSTSIEIVASSLSMKIGNEIGNAQETDQRNSTLCKVCGEEATKYVHYGGRSCASCRAFFRRSVESVSRSRGFRYFCNCAENCSEKEQPTCDVNKLTRNNCKYCRYEKCTHLAGMNSQWVISAHIPKVKRNPNKRVATSKTKMVPFEVESSENNLLENITSVYRLNMNPTSNLLEMAYEFKIDVEGGKKKISIEIQDSLESFVKQMIFSRSKAIPEFESLKPSIQHVMLKNNYVALLRLGIIEFLYDIISIEASSSFATLSDMYIIWETSFWNNKSIRGPASRRIEMKRLIRKILEMVEVNRRIFSFLYPILLLHTPYDDRADNQHNAGHQLAYMNLLNNHFMNHSHENHEYAAIQLGKTNEILNYLHCY